MKTYTITEYEKKDYEQQEAEIDVMEFGELAEWIRHIARGWLPDYNFTGSEEDFDSHKKQMIMRRVANVLEEMGYEL